MGALLEHTLSSGRLEQPEYSARRSLGRTAEKAPLPLGLSPMLTPRRNTIQLTAPCTAPGYTDKWAREIVAIWRRS